MGGRGRGRDEKKGDGGETGGGKRAVLKVVAPAHELVVVMGIVVMGHSSASVAGVLDLPDVGFAHLEQGFQRR